MASTSKIGASVIKNFSIKENVRLYKLKAQKSLSQNFILDENICKKIIKQAGKVKDSFVCEVGPGPGGLTKAIIDAGAAHLSVIEKDDRFFPTLEELNKASGGKIKFYHGDVLKFNMHNVFPNEIAKNWNETTPSGHIIGNLPFAVSTALTIRWLKEISLKEGAWSKGRIPLTLTFQKEVADRMVAKAMDRNRCRLSVMCQNWCHVDRKFTIPGKVFVPPPKVDVGVVQFVPRVTPGIDVPFEYVEKLLRHIFHFRMKMCKRGIQTLFPHDRPELTKRLLEASEVHPDSRPFMLEMDDFARLCSVYKSICDEEPDLLIYNYRSQENALLWRTELEPLEI